LLAHFARPPYGYAVDVVRACVVGLLRAGKVKIRTDTGAEMTSVRDPDVKSFFSRDRDLRVADLFPTKEDEFSPRDRNAVCKLFEDALGDRLDRDNDAIADAVFRHFPPRRERLRGTEGRLMQLPDRPALPESLKKLGAALEVCCGDRHVLPTVKNVKRKLDVLRDGLQTLAIYESELTDDAVRRVAVAGEVRDHQLAQLVVVGQGGELAGQAEAIQLQLGLERPWREIASLDGALEAIRTAYRLARRSLLEQQEADCDRARNGLKRRAGFDSLDGDAQHQVLRPITQAGFVTADDAIAPSLEQLRDQFPGRLHRAVDEANDLLDEFLAKKKVTVTSVRHNLQNLEIANETQLKEHLDDLQRRVVERLAKGERVRLV
jgi:hypothetical protein